MKRKMLTLLGALVAIQVCSAAIVDEYTFTMFVQVPRIYDNMHSLGSRKYQYQRLKGTLNLTWEAGEVRPTVTIVGLTNITHRINGACISYKTTIDEGTFVYPRFNVIGNNRTGIFKTGSVVFYVDADPSYNIGEDMEDNSLLLTLSGRSTTKVVNGRMVFNAVRGYAAGTLGCGCKAYGHTSPTRVMGVEGPTDYVDDVAAVFGSWNMRYKRSYVVK